MCATGIARSRPPRRSPRSSTPKLAWLRSAFLQAWNDGPVVIVFIRSSDKYTLPLRLQAFSNKTEPTGTGDGGRRALA